MHQEICIATPLDPQVAFCLCCAWLWKCKIDNLDRRPLGSGQWINMDCKDCFLCMQRLPLLGLGAQCPHHHHLLVALAAPHHLSCGIAHGAAPCAYVRLTLMALEVPPRQCYVVSLLHGTLAGPLAAGAMPSCSLHMMDGTPNHPGPASDADSPPVLELPYLPPDPHLFATKLGEGKNLHPASHGPLPG